MLDSANNICYSTTRNKENRSTIPISIRSDEQEVMSAYLLD